MLNIWQVMISSQKLDQVLLSNETKNLEFKEARNNFDKEKLLKYCVALSNEMGGMIILGVSDKLPHQVVGTNVFQNFASLEKDVFDLLKFRIEISELYKDNKRILAIEIPSRPIGTPIEYKGSFWMRLNDSIEPMSNDHLRKIYAEAQIDYSAHPCHDATLNDLSNIAIEMFRMLWSKKSNKQEILTSPLEQLLIDAELLVDGKLNNAALILLGKKESLGKYLANAEIIFEYRYNDASIESQQRIDYRAGFLGIQDKIWDQINLRNNVHHIQEGLFIKDIQYFNEEVIREALLNAVCHRDYQLNGSVFIKQYPSQLVIENPGGFPVGITPENIIYKHSPRNRRIAEVFQKCGLVERAGQGADKIFRKSIEESKPLPDYSKSDPYSVILQLKSDIQDVHFLQFFEKVINEKLISFNIDDLLLLDQLRQGLPPSERFQNNIHRLVENGIIEIYSRGKGTKYILTKKYYTYVDQKGVYTRRRGLENIEKKELILKHLRTHGKGKYEEFQQIFPNLSKFQIHSLLKSLKRTNKIKHVGPNKTGHWILGE
jgi:ATP-dependent DNA helicase RecG